MLYFAYGSNLNKVDMKKRCPDSLPVSKVRLFNYKLVFNGLADVIESKGNIVDGAIYQVSDRDIINLDLYEEYPKLYTKINVIVQGEDGESYEAFVYVMVKKGLGEPPEKYYKTIMEGYRHWNLPVDKLQQALKEFKY